MCVECGTVLSVSSSPVAQQERNFIREQIAAGKDKQQIMDALVAEYGKDVLAEPEHSGFNLALWAVPIALVLLAAAGIGVALRRWRTREPASEETMPAPLSAEDARRLDAELKLVTEGVDTTVIAAFAVGFVSFISPCVLPLVPGYLSAVSGVSIAEMKSGERNQLKILLPAIVFCLSFTVVFVALGMTATGLGSSLQASKATLDKIAGLVIIGLGVFFLLTPFVSQFNREWRPDALISRAGSGGPLIAGAAFAVAWTPCVGPTLGSILSAAATQDTVGQGGVLLAFYSLGLAVPFLLTAIAFTRMTTAFRWLRDHYLVITALSGVVLITMGLLLFTGELARLNIEAQNALDNLGLNFFKSV